MKFARSPWLALILLNVNQVWCQEKSSYVAKVHRQSDTGYQERSVPIANPRDDGRKYAALNLKNNLKVVLVSDPKLASSSAYLQVKAGYKNDNKAIPGLSHFLEHATFLRNRKYLGSTEYKDFISKNSGRAPAYTWYEETDYFFEVDNDSFSEALDRFAQNFISPLFNATELEREMSRVDSEFNISFNSDKKRLDRLKKHIGDPDHPYSIQFKGNKKSIMDIPRSKGMDIRKELIKFYESFYLANNMRLVVVGQAPIDNLKDMTLSAFSSMKERDLKIKHYSSSPFRTQDKGILINVATQSESRSLELNFALPSQFGHLKELPLKFIKHHILSKGPNSVESILSRKGWATRFYSEDDKDYTEISEFTLSVALTHEGLGKCDEIIRLIFKALNTIKHQGITKERFQDLKIRGEMSSKYSEHKGSFAIVKSLGQALTYTDDISKILDYSEYPKVFNESLIREFIDFINPQSMRVFVMSPENSELSGLLAEPWYGTKYKVQPLSRELLSSLESISNAPVETLSSEFKLPDPNPYFPDNFVLVHENSNAGRPTLVEKTSSGQLWHSVSSYKSPKATLNLYFKNTNIPQSTSIKAQLRIIVAAIQIQLSDKLSQMEDAGIKVNIKNEPLGISVNLSGFSNKLELVFKEVLDSIKELKITKDNLAKAKSKLLMAQNADLQTYLGAKSNPLLELALIGSANELDKELEDYYQSFTVPGTTDIYKQLIHNSKIVVFSTGNILISTTKKLMAHAKRDSNSLQSFSKKSKAPQTVIIPQGGEFVYKYQEQDPDRQVSSTGMLFDIGSKFNYRTAACAEFLENVLSVGVLDQLSVKESLAYLAGAHKKVFGSRVGIFIQVEGSRDPVFVESRIGSFIAGFIKSIKKMSPMEFKKQLVSFTSKYTYNNLHDQEAINETYWESIKSSRIDFDRTENIIKNIKSITQKRFVKILNSKFKKGSPKRRKLSLHLIAKNSQEQYLKSQRDPKLNPGNYIGDLAHWKQDMLKNSKK